MRIFSKVCVLLFVAILAFSAAIAAESSFRGIEVLTGMGFRSSGIDSDLDTIPLFVNFDFDVKPCLKKHRINPPGLFQFCLEPYVSYAYEPVDSQEAGFHGVFKVGLLPESTRLQPYIKAGLGFMYITRHAKGQGSKLNFDEFAGLGAHYNLNRATMLTVEFRFRHASNCDLKKPNPGINTSYLLFGISRSF